VLANCLKAFVLTGDTMKVFFLMVGIDFNQGVAYLDDGTMVVVDNARKMIGKTVDISVTSVLQTTAGKMIFGKWDERGVYRPDQRTVVTPVTTVAAMSAVIPVPAPEPKKPSPVLAERPVE